ncbi:MAG: PBSX family phage terminase large subunit [Candidatus Heimdallarchaeaceae archaeon]
MAKIEAEVTKVYDWLEQTTARINILRGGTRSSKTYSLAQHFIFNKLIKGNNRVIIIARKTLPALKKTAYKLFIDLLEKYRLYDSCKLNKADLELRYKNNIIYFMSLDDPHKIGSLDFNDAWLEEATEFTFNDFTQFNIRASRPGGNNQIFLSFNPVSALHWIKTELLDKRKDIAENVSTYKDNIKHLPPELIKEIEDLINQDQNFYKVYTLGEWGVLENIIYSGWETYNKIEYRNGIKFIDGLKIDDITYGLDFGFTHPSVLTEINWIEDNFIVRELLYQTGLTNAELIERVKKLIPVEHRYREIYADHSEPARINEFYQAGFNIHKAKKDVLPGIDFCKTHMLGITSDSINGIKELQSYKRREDKDGNVMEEPVKFNDDFCDSFRYGAYSKLSIMGESQLADFSLR